MARYEILPEPRARRDRVKEGIGGHKGYVNKKLVAESVSDRTYQPGQRARKFRLVILRKNLGAQRGAQALREEVRYFLYRTNRGI